MSLTGRNLRIPRSAHIGVGTAAAKTIREQWDTIDAVEAENHAKGLMDRARPTEECPEITADVLTGPDSRQYTELYLLLLSWFTYTSELLAQVQSRILQFQNMKDIIASRTRQQLVENLTKKLSKDETEDRILLNDEYQEVLHNLQRYQQAKVLLSVKVESIERGLRLVSRQVEIRRLDIEQNRTSTAMPTRGQRSPQTQDPPTLPPSRRG